MIRTIKPSKDAIESLGKKKKRIITSKFPLCPWSHPSWGERQRHILIQQEKHKKRKVVDPMPNQCDMTGRKKFELICKNCKAIQGTVWLKDGMEDWCSFRYKLILTKEEWRGGYGPNINPYTGALSIECSCGCREHNIKEV